MSVSMCFITRLFFNINLCLMYFYSILRSCKWMIRPSGWKRAWKITKSCFTGMGDHYATGYRSKKDKIAIVKPTLQSRMWWFRRRISIDVVRLLGVFFLIACVSPTWGLSSSLDTTSLAYMTIIFVILDVIIFVEWGMAFWKDQQEFFPDQRVTYFVYSLFLGVPMGTLTKIIWFVYRSGGSDIEHSNVFVPYIILLVLLSLLFLFYLLYDVKIACSYGTVSDFFRKFFRKIKTTRYVRKVNIKCGLCAFLGIVFVTIYWVSVAAFLRQTGAYGDTVDPDWSLWIVSLIPLWIIVGIVFVVAGIQFWSMFCKGIH